MDLKGAIRGFIAENFFYSVEESTYTDSDSFLKEGIIDSLGVMDLVTFVGTSFGITVAPEDVTAENFDSVNNLIAYIERKREMPTIAEQNLSLQA
jgi:acyl carrier protein